MPTARRRKLRAVRPNVGIENLYRRRMWRIIDAMHESVMFWVRQTFKANEPEVVAIATDESPAATLRKTMRRMSRQWQRNFNRAAPLLADYFATSVDKRSEAALKKILKDAGMAIEFKMTPAQRDILSATIGAQVGLIKSIPQKYLQDVEGHVMRAVQKGMDLQELTKALQTSYGVTRRRAALIARDQSNKATASMTRARQIDAGLFEAEWVHSGGGKEPRPTHVAAGKRRQRYDVRKGWYDPAVKRHIFPGEEINCRCVSRSVIPGF
jgi:uncharacterized protein with gpF-like domain